MLNRWLFLLVLGSLGPSWGFWVTTPPRPAHPPRDSLRLANNQAVLLARRGQYATARRLLGPYANGPSDTARYNLALLELQGGNPDRAAQLLASAPDFRTARFNLGVAVCLQGDYEAGLVQLNAAPTATETSDKLAYNLGLLILRLSGPPNAALARRKPLARRTNAQRTAAQADSYFRRAILLNPTEARYHLARVDALLSDHHYDEALRVGQQALDQTAHPVLLAQLGLAALGAHREAEAIGFFTQYLQSRDRSRQQAALLGMAHALYRQRAFGRAMQVYRRVLQLNPALAGAHAGLGHALCALHDYRAAARAYDEALRHDSLHRYAHVGRAVSAFRLGDYPLAVRHFALAGNALDERNREHFDFFICQGFSVLRAGQKGADALFLAAARLNRRSPVAYAGLSESYIKTQRFAAAGLITDEALDRDRQNDRLLTNRANLLLKTDDFDQAQAHYRRALAVNPHNLNALNGLAVTLLELNRIDEAKHLYDSLIQRSPRMFLYNNRGIVKAYAGLRDEREKKLREGQYAYHQALKDFAKAQEMDSARAFYNNNAGNVYKNLGDFEHAALCYQGYLSKSAINNMGVLFADAAKQHPAHHYFNVALRLDTTNFTFLYNRARLYYLYFRDSLTRHNQLGPVLALLNQLPQNSMATRYSKDGYISIYLFDYQYDTYDVPGEYTFPVEVETLEQHPFLPVLDFVTMGPDPPPLVVRPNTVVRITGKNPQSAARRSRRWGSTRCPE